MNRSEQDRWKSNTLDRVFELLARSPAIVDSLIFKGARVLNLHLGTQHRQSLDLDSNLSADFVEHHPDRGAQEEWLRRELTRALERGFERGDPVRYRLDRVRILRHPPGGHPHGWNTFKVTLTIRDLRLPARNYPRLDLDVSAPEELTPVSVTPLNLGGSQIRAYTLERIAGEKLRAFLTSLPQYIAKLGARPPGPTGQGRLRHRSDRFAPPTGGRRILGGCWG